MTDPTHQEDAEIDKALYPCSECGTMQTKDEGGTVFTVCDACWDKLHPEPNGVIRTLVPTDDFGGKIFRSSQEADEFAALREDKARLDWLIKQGPPGATEGNWLTDEVWELATMFAADSDGATDAMAVRAAIDAARKKA